MIATRLRTALVVGALVAASGLARAEGPGVDLGGRLVLHPGLALETRYDSNVFFQPTNENWAFLLRVLPTLDIATRPAQRGGATPHVLDFRLHAGLDYLEYLTSSKLITQHRALGVQAGMLATLFPFGQFTLDVFDNYTRTTQPPYTLVPYNLDRDTNEAGFRLRYRPGTGRLEVDLGYVFGLDYFEVNVLDDLDLTYHRVTLGGQWKFLPKTALFVEASETPYLYRHSTIFSHPNSYQLRVVAGLNGLITPRLTLRVWAGYGNGFYVSGPSPSIPIAGLDATWKPTFLSTGGIGYRHDFVNSLLGSYYDLDEVYARWAQLIWRFTASARVAYQHEQFHGILPQTAVVPAGRVDDYVSLDVRLEYPVRDWLTVSAGYDLQYNTSTAHLDLGGGGPAGIVPVDYTKHEGWIRLAVLY